MLLLQVYVLLYLTYQIALSIWSHKNIRRKSRRPIISTLRVVQAACYIRDPINVCNKDYVYLPLNLKSRSLIGKRLIRIKHPDVVIGINIHATNHSNRLQ